MPRTSRHADLRARKRIGVSDISHQFEVALAEGTYQKDLKGSLRRFIDNSAKTHKANCVIHKNIVYWFGKDRTLITVIPLHQKWHKYLKADKTKPSKGVSDV